MPSNRQRPASTPTVVIRRLAVVLLLCGALSAMLLPAPARAQSTWEPTSGVAQLSGSANLKDLSGATMTPDGRLWSVDNRLNTIASWSKSNGSWHTANSWDIGHIGSTTISDPEAITWIQGNRFAVMDEATNRLHYMTIAGSSVTIDRSVSLSSWSAPSGGDGLEGLAYSHDESTSSADVFYAGDETTARLFRVTVPAGANSTSQVTSTNLGIPEIAGLADSPNSSDLYVISESNKTIYRTDTNGSSPVALFSASAMTQPEGIYFDASDNTLHVIGEGAQEHATWQIQTPPAPTPEPTATPEPTPTVQPTPTAPPTPLPTPTPQPTPTAPPTTGGEHAATAIISASADDAEQRASGSMYLTSSDLELTWDGGGHQLVGLRFRNLAVPAGATITHATLEFETDERTSGSTSLAIRGEASADAAAFTNSWNNIGARSTTTAVTTWSPAPWNTTSQRHRSPDVAAVVQEIVDTSGWTAGNALALIINGTGERTAESYDGESHNAPRLHLRWTEATGPRPTPSPTPQPSPTTVPPSEPTTIVAAITSGKDDVEVRSNGSLNRGSGDLDIASPNRPVGLRFHLCVPAGATITDSRLVFTADEADSAPTSAVVAVERSANAAAFTQQNLATRTYAPTGVSWPSWSVWHPGTTETSPNLASLVADVVGLPSWSGCGHIVLTVTGSGDREASSYNSNPAAAPTLSVTFE